MDLKGIMLSYIRQTEKENTLWSHVYVESKKTIKKTQHTPHLIDTENRLVVARGGGWGGRNVWKFLKNKNKFKKESKGTL